MNNIKSDNYVVIQGFMIKDLELKGTELFVYAIIYGFSQDGESYFTGSRNYLAKWCNVSLPTIDIALKNLCDKGYIIKEQNVVNNVIFNRYKVVLGVVKNFYGGSKETLGGSKETLHNNINIINKINNNKKENILKEKYGKYGRVKLTIDEYLRLVNEFGEEFIKNQIDLLDEYIESNNNKNKYTNFNLVLRKSIREEWFKTKNKRTLSNIKIDVSDFLNKGRTK